MDKHKTFASVVIYVHNDAGIIQGFLEKVFCEIDALFEDYEFIFVNDHSTDAGVEVISEFVKDRPSGEFSLVNMGNFQGLETSMKAGVDLAIGDFIFEFDTAVVDYDVSLIKEVFDMTGEGNDIVIASRKHAGVPSRAFHRLFNSFSSLNSPLSPRTFSVISRRAVNRVDSMATIIPYRKAQYASSNLNLEYIAYSNDRKMRKRSVRSKKERHSAVIDAVLLFTSISYKISLFLTFFMALFMVLSGVYVIVTYLTEGPVSGWAPIMGIASAGFFGVFIIFSIIIKYLDLLLKIAFRRQSYLISSVEKLKRSSTARTEN